MKTALITGSNKGIGFEIARELAGRGFRVWLSGRHEEATRKAAATLQQRNLDAAFVPFDVSNLDSIRNAFRTLAREAERLDVLVNNAGVLLDESESILTVTPEVVYQTVHTNALGAFFVTQMAIPLFRSGSRVINISSGAGRICDGMSSYSPVYSISKTAMNAITCQFAHALKSRGVAVNAVNPGWVRTEMGGSAAVRSVEKGAETAVWLATEAPISKTGLFWQDMKVISW